MQPLSRCHDKSNVSLGQRRGVSDLARFSLDLTRAGAELESAARSKDYPSPPMSGSPPLPPKPTQEAAGVRSQGSYGTASQDAYYGAPTAHGDAMLHQPGVPTLGRAFPAEPPERLPYAFSRPEEPVPRALPYPPQPGHALPQPPYPYLPLPGPGPMPPAFPVSPRPPAPISENAPYVSPKSQRKTKGHVASACVPCKKAHLRCDAQRPCSRCLSNGKEDACIDVQHKKRGRPRLREDKDMRYDIPGRGGHAAEAASTRRPLSLYGPSPAMGSGYDDSIRRGQSYRVLKSHQPADPVPPRFIERGSVADANIYPAPLSISTRTPEPAAFLTMNFEIANASPTFTDAIGRQSVKGHRLVDVIAPADRDRVLGHQRQLQDEQARREHRYLPPIISKKDEDRVIQGLGFSPEEMARYALDKQDFLTFSAHDGQPRSYPIRLGLAKEDSVYFAVIVLNIAIRPLGHPTPSPHSRDLRDIPYAYQPQQQQHQPQQHYSQPTPVSATFDVGRPRMGSDTGFGPRQPATPAPMLSGLSPGLPSSYAASPSRPDYPAGPSSYQVPRSELVAATRTSQQPGYQLPPIRSHHETGHGIQDPPGPRDDKSRVDIGGLIEKPEPPRRMQ